MINVLIPMAGGNQYFSEGNYPFPKPLIEIGNATVIQHVISNLASLAPDVQFTFVLNNADCRKFHLDNILKILTDHKCNIIRLENQTRGAACSALMAVSQIGNDSPLIIANADQVFEFSLNRLIADFGDSAAGVITFDSVHPRWSYVRLDEKRYVVETAEKRPISREAIAGLYYFRRGSDFVEAAMRMIRKDSNVNGDFFIAPVMNELILDGKKITTVHVDVNLYHTFYTPQRIKEFESKLSRLNLTPDAMTEWTHRS